MVEDLAEKASSVPPERGFDPGGLEKADRRLVRATRAFDDVRKAGNWAEFEPAWSDFLLASNAVFSIIEQAAKSSSKGPPWFGRYKKERKDDPLLSYMHHARNSDEHGIEPVAQDLPWMAGPVPESGKLVSLSFSDGKPTGAVVKGQSGEEFSLTIAPPRPNLIRVFDRRYGDSFDPPNLHLGKPIEPGNPYSAGEALLAYLEAMVASARAFPRT
ncbi:MAG: hypothetical protein Q7J28_07990 [Caulobacter sp.]|nr:hypothetical protein [Caulobacter sp.]